LTCLSWTAGEADDEHAAFEQALRELQRVLKSQGLQILQERLYIESGSTKEILAIRDQVFADFQEPNPSSPTVLVNRPCLDVPCAGFHYLAVSLEPGIEVETLSSNAGPAGRLLRWRNGKALFLPSDEARQTGSSLATMFERCVERLNEQGMGLRDVGRTWLYLRDLLNDYDELNKVRNDFFTRHGIGSVGNFVCPPASTGIQGFHPDGRASFMETLALKTSSEERPFRTIQPEIQCEAWDYGSVFSRGMLIDLADSSLTTLSGTASIGTSGKTLHVGNPQKQLVQAVRSIENLLSGCNKPRRPKGLWTLYFKDEETWSAWREATRLGHIEPIQGPAVYADVCRDDLLFELELTLPS
jgi:hypothetical protein